MPFKYGNLVVGSFELADGSVTTPKLADNAVSTAKIVNDAITAAKMATDSVQEDSIAAGAVSLDKVAANAINADKIVDDAISAAKLATGSVELDKIASNAVNADKIVDAAVTTDKIDALAVTAAKIGTAAVETAKIDELAVTEAKIGALAVTNAKIAALAVDAAKIATAAIETAKIEALAVTEAKIGDLAVTNAKIDALAVTEAKIGALAVTSAKIAAAAIQTAHIEDLAVTDAKILELTVDKLLAGALSVTSFIESDDYDASSEDQISGFHIDGDGSAIFADVVVGSTDYFINDEGHASFEEVNTEALNVAGDTLEEILDQRPRGIIAYSSRVPDVSITGLSEQAITELHALLVDKRMYRIQTNRVQLDPGSQENYRCGLHLRHTIDGTVPDTSSNILDRDGLWIADNGVYSHSMQIDNVYTCDSEADIDFARNLHPGEVRFLLTFQHKTGDSSTETTLYTSGGNYAQISIIIEDIGPLIENTGIDHSGSGGSGGSGTGGDTIQEFTKTYTATATKAYNGDGSENGASGPSQGNGSFSPNGNMSSIFGFDQAQIQSDLSGATILSCKVYLYYDHWHFNGGGTAIIGTHDVTNVGSASSRPTSDMNEDRVRSANWDRNEGRWVGLGTSIGGEFKSGAATGICIGRAPTSSDTYYGKTRAHNESNPPKLRIKYTKQV